MAFQTPSLKVAHVSNGVWTAPPLSNDMSILKLFTEPSMTEQDKAISCAGRCRPLATMLTFAALPMCFFGLGSRRAGDSVSSQPQSPLALANHRRVDTNLRQQQQTWRAKINVKHLFNRTSQPPALIDTANGDLRRSRMLELSLQWKLQ